MGPPREQGSGELTVMCPVTADLPPTSQPMTALSSVCTGGFQFTTIKQIKSGRLQHTWTSLKRRGPPEYLSLLHIYFSVHASWTDGTTDASMLFGAILTDVAQTNPPPGLHTCLLLRLQPLPAFTHQPKNSGLNAISPESHTHSSGGQLLTRKSRLPHILYTKYVG
uniref:Uncharacterized protein n=1 Tax=Knipowitschia caucasica TaxID=637954 RepID=A0AAV2MKC5_KNICA